MRKPELLFIIALALWGIASININAFAIQELERRVSKCEQVDP